MAFRSAIHRAAVVIKSLPKKQAAAILAKLDPKELQQIAHELRATEKNVPKEISQQAKLKFMASVHDCASSLSISNSDESNQAPFEFLNPVSSDLRFELIRNEHPSVVATVLSIARTDVASDLLMKFEPEAKFNILKRICQIKNLDQKVLLQISLRLEKRMQKMLETAKLANAGVEAASKLLSCSDPFTRSQVFEMVKSSDSELAAQINRRIVKVSDIKFLDDDDVKTILKWADTALWAPALKTEAKSIQRKVLRNMAERPRGILQNEIKALIEIDMITSNTAKVKLIETMISLSEKGVISLQANMESEQRAA